MTRRAALAAGLGGLAVASTACATPASSADEGRTVPRRAHGDAARKLRELERRHDARLGVFAFDTASGRTLASYRADELFPMCSTFKTIAAAAVLRDLDTDGEFLAKVVHYTEADTEKSGYAPVTGLPENLAKGMSVAELCDAALTRSDNAAANLLLTELGGPTAVTRFCRSIGDRVTRLDRWEPELNSAEPWRRTDTTSPRAIGDTYLRLAGGQGSILDSADRERLTGWLLRNTTGDHRIRAGVPSDWTVGDKTGGGSAYGVTNDVAIAWPPGRAPLVIAVLTTFPHEPDAPNDEPLVADAAGIVADTLT